MSIIKEIYWAIRYGEWSCGWEQWKDKPQFTIYSTWYDGQCAKEVVIFQVIIQVMSLFKRFHILGEDR